MPAVTPSMVSRLAVAVVLFGNVAVLALDESYPPQLADLALAGDDECSSEGQHQGCALAALQLRADPTTEAPSSSAEDEVEVVHIDKLPAGWTPETDYPEIPGMIPEDAVEGQAAVEIEGQVAIGGCPAHPQTKRCYLYAACHSQGYCVMGGYMIVPGRYAAGMESINGGNAASFDYLMVAAKNHCSGTHCVLITNPPPYRTQDQLHIHFRHYSSGGAVLKGQLERSLCPPGGHHHSGWKSFRKCSSGKARLFDHFPGVFSEVAAAYGGRSLFNVGITVWFTTACGPGTKTIILATTDCSIEHSVSAR